MIASITLALTFASSGAYDTDDLTAPHRAILWTVVCSLIVFQAFITDTWFERLVNIGKASSTVRAFGSILATCLLTTVELYALKFTPLLPKAHDPFLDLFLFVLMPVSTIAISVILYRRTSGRRYRSHDRQRLNDEHSIPPLGLEPNASARPAGWPLAPVLLVHACDHYLEIWTSRGKVFLKGRMTDAVVYLADTEGAQVHRSWWVSRSAARSIERQGRDWFIITDIREPIPVSRGRTKQLRDLDWPFQ